MSGIFFDKFTQTQPANSPDVVSDGSWSPGIVGTSTRHLDSSISAIIDGGSLKISGNNTIVTSAILRYTYSDTQGIADFRQLLIKLPLLFTNHVPSNIVLELNDGNGIFVIVGATFSNNTFIWDTNSPQFVKPGFRLDQIRLSRLYFFYNTQITIDSQYGPITSCKQGPSGGTTFNTCGY